MNTPNSQWRTRKTQTRHTAASAVYLLLMMMAACSAVAQEHEPYWTPTGTGILGVGAIHKVSPTQTSDLHWNRGTGPEYASFEITLSNPEDCDTYHWWDDWEEEWESTTYNRNISWLNQWIASAGTMSTSGYFTPGDTTNNHVTIECFVYDCSAEWSGDIVDADYNDDGDDASVHREWNGALRVFKVGVYMPADNTYFWEDSTYLLTEFVLKTDLSNLECSKVSTLQGITDLTASSTGWDITRTWTTVTQPSGCDIMGGISHGPFIAANGMLEVYFQGYCSAPSTLSSIASVLEGAAGTFPLGDYEPAVTAITHVFGSGNCDAVAGVAMKTVIQYAGENGHKIEEGPWSDFSALVFAGSINASCLSVWANVCYKTGATTTGSVSAKSQVAINDDSPYQFAYATVEEVLSDDNYLSYGTMRPSYSHTYPHQEE